MAKAPLVTRSSGSKLGSLLTRDRVQAVDTTKSPDKDLDLLLDVVRKARRTAKISASTSRTLERASKNLS
jgi:hypothetical protein